MKVLKWVQPGRIHTRPSESEKAKEIKSLNQAIYIFSEVIRITSEKNRYPIVKVLVEKREEKNK